MPGRWPVADFKQEEWPCVAVRNGHNRDVSRFYWFFRISPPKVEVHLFGHFHFNHFNYLNARVFVYSAFGGFLIISITLLIGRD